MKKSLSNLLLFYLLIFIPSTLSASSDGCFDNEQCLTSQGKQVLQNLLPKDTYEQFLEEVIKKPPSIVDYQNLSDYFGESFTVNRKVEDFLKGDSEQKVLLFGCGHADSVYYDVYESLCKTFADPNFDACQRISIKDFNPNQFLGALDYAYAPTNGPCQHHCKGKLRNQHYTVNIVEGVQPDLEASFEATEFWSLFPAASFSAVCFEGYDPGDWHTKIFQQEQIKRILKDGGHLIVHKKEVADEEIKDVFRKYPFTDVCFTFVKNPTALCAKYSLSAKAFDYYEKTPTK